MEARADRPGTVRLRLEKVDGPKAAAITLSVAFAGLKSGDVGMNLAANRDDGDLYVDLRGEDFRKWVHGLTGGSSVLLTFPRSSEPPRSLDLKGTSAAVDAMQRCILELQITDVPPPFSPWVKSPVPAQPAAAVVPPGIPAGYVAVQTVPVGSGGEGVILQVLEDRRLTPAAREKMWRTSADPTFALGEQDPVVKALGSNQPLHARLRLLHMSGKVVAEEKADAPLAKIEAASLHGMPSPTFFYTVDLSTGMGSYSGPVTVMLQPTTNGLRPIEAVSPDGQLKQIGLAETGKAGWKIVRPRAGVTEEIESYRASLDAGTTSASSDDVRFIVTYMTYRFTNGQWHVSRKTNSVSDDVEAFPDRSLFP